MRWLLDKIIGFLKFLLKEIFRFIFRIILTIILISVIVFSIYKNQEEKLQKSYSKEYEYVEIDLGKEYAEGEIDPLKMVVDGEMNYFTLQQSIKNIGDDSKVKGVIFKIDNFALSGAQSEEIGKLIQKIKSSKKVYMYGTGITRGAYDFALNGEIIMPPTSTAQGEITGYRATRPFYKRLGEKLGVTFTVVHIGNYKSFGENLTSTSMSEFSKENMLALLNGFYDRFITRVSNIRGLDKERFNSSVLNGEFALVTPYELKEKKLIDTLEYYYDLKERLGEKGIIPLEEYYHLQNGKNEIFSNKTVQSKGKIGIVTLDGDIIHLGEPQGRGGVTFEKVESSLKMAMEDPNIKGIVLRINSPGGSALTSEMIYQLVIKMKEKYKKPVYISMGSVAASGGYYISTSGDKIFANETTITGSIGVVSIIPNIKELTNKIGIDIVNLSNGENTDIYSILEKPDEKRLELLLKSSKDVYGEFKERVSKGRGLTLEEVEKVAQGRVWTGEEGLKNKLVDGIASLDETVEILAQDLKMEKGSYDVEEIYEVDIKGRLKGYLKLLGKEETVKALLTQYLYNGRIENINNLNIEINKPVLYSDIEVR